MEARVKEAAALGFREAVVPRSNLGDAIHPALPVLGVTSIQEAIDALLG